MLKQILQTLSPLLACLFLAGRNIYSFPDQMSATPVQPVYYYGYKPPIQQLKPVHGTGYKPPIGPINPPLNNVAPSHVTITTPAASKAIDKKKKPAMEGHVN